MADISKLILAHLDLACTDFDAWVRLLDDDIVIEFPFGPSANGPSRVAGKSAVIAAIRPFLDRVPSLRFRNPTIYPCVDPSEAFATYDAEALVIDNGRHYSQNYIAHFREKDGKLVFLSEYFDPLRTLEALGP